MFGFIGTIIGAVIIGGIVGSLARLVLPGKQKMGLVATVGIGFVAALIGGFIAQLLGVGSTAGVDWIKLAIQVGLAVVGIGFYSGRFLER